MSKTPKQSQKSYNAESDGSEAEEEGYDYPSEEEEEYYPSEVGYDYDDYHPSEQTVPREHIKVEAADPGPPVVDRVAMAQALQEKNARVYLSMIRDLKDKRVLLCN